MATSRYCHYGSYKQQTKNKFANLILSIGGISLISYGIWWFYWPRHAFPANVAKNLRKGLWEESDKSNNDYQSALRYYIEALNECDKLNMDPICDEYTGIQLKCAEMMEKLNMQKEAHGLYMEILNRYYNALNLLDVIPEEKRAHFIQKDLRILIKSLELSEDSVVSRRHLLAHLLLAQEEILSKSPELKSFFDRRKDESISKQNLDTNSFESFINEENIKLSEDGYMILNLQKNSSAWEPFKDEFFTARDLYTAYCLSSKDIVSALSCKMTTVEWMIMADMPPGQILLSQANLGSLLYLQGEQTEGQIYNITKKLNEVPNNKDLENTLKLLNKKRDTYFSMASKCYESIISFAKSHKKLRFNAKDLMDPSAAQAIALSTYGMGVINLHQGILAKAERLLQDSISLAQESDFQELFKEANQELSKVHRAKKNQQDVK